MIRVSILYPPSEKFDQDYYIKSHMKLVADRVGDALVKFEVDKGLSGAAPGSPAPYAAVGHLYFNSVPEFVQAFANTFVYGRRKRAANSGGIRQRLPQEGLSPFDSSFANDGSSKPSST